MVIKGSLVAVAKVVGASVLSGCLLWQIAQRAGPQTNEVVVHVTEYPAMVKIDGRPYRVKDRWGTPFACPLHKGWHELEMWRGGRLVYREKFWVQLGENITMTVLDPRQRSKRPTDQK